MTKVSRRREVLVHVLLSLGVCVAVVLVLNRSITSLGLFARQMGIAAVYSVCIGVPGYLSLTRAGPRLARLRAPWNWTIFLAACVAVAIAGCMLSILVLAGLGLCPMTQYWLAFAGAIRLSIVITLAFGIGNFLYETMRGKLERARLEEERARFSSLESRIHPHFLFNTLNSISALIREDPRKAERTVEQLSALLR